jgi:hypothetical protein
VKLKASMSVRGDRIDYTLNPATGVHELWFAMSGARYTASCSGEIANVLAPYRGFRDVDELFAWLCR